MSYTEVINEETVKFIQKSTELILQFRDFDKNTYKRQYREEANTQQAYQQDRNVNQQGDNNLYDRDFQLVNQTFFGFIRKHAQNFQNWTMPEQKELTIEIFGQKKIASVDQPLNNLSYLNKNVQQNQNAQAHQQNSGQLSKEQTESYKMEEWRFVFRHLNSEEESSDKTQRVMNPQQFIMNLSILTRSILSILTNMPVFKNRDYLKISRRVHFTRGTVNDFQTNLQQVPLKVETFSKKVYLLHHVFEFQVRYLIDAVNDQYAIISEIPSITETNRQQSIKNQLSSFSIYSQIDDSSSLQSVTNTMSKQLSQVEKLEVQEVKQSKETFKQSYMTTNQSILDMDFSSLSSVSPRNTYSPPNFALNKLNKAPKKYSEDLTTLKKNIQDSSPQLDLINKQELQIREKSHTIKQPNVEESQQELLILRRKTESEHKKDQIQDQLDQLLDKLTSLGDPYYANSGRSVQDVLQTILA